MAGNGAGQMAKRDDCGTGRKRRLDRRRFLMRMALAACAAPAAAALLAACGGGTGTTGTSSSVASVAPTAPASSAAPSASESSSASASTGAAAGGKRGAGGTLKLLYWQAPTIVNAHFSQGTKDYHASRIVMEPLISADSSGKFQPILAAEVPSPDNGGVSRDGKSVTYKLKQGIKWADGQPFTADDVVFTWEFVANKETAAVTAGSYLNVDKVEALDANTVKITFKAPTAGWFIPFSGETGMIIPKHALKDYVGAKAREAPFNLKSFGTGPYKVESFKPGDLVVYSINEHYREPDKPYFKEVQLKGGGDATSAARAVFQTGEFDYAWNLQVEANVLAGLERGGKGDLLTEAGGGVEQIFCNFSNPDKEVDGQRSYYKEPHPFLTDPKVRQALAMAIDRDSMAKQLYGPAGDASTNTLTTPTSLNSPNTKAVYDIDGANKLLDEAGWVKGPDGIRAKNGIRLHVRYATSVNTLRQKEQEIVKQGWQKIGVETELKSVDAGVFFSGAPGNPDTFGHFYTDVEMFTSTFGSPDPSRYMKRFYSGDPARDIAQKDNQWAPDNMLRYQNPEFNKLYDQAQTELDPGKNRDLWIKMNDLVVNDHATIPLINRKIVSAKARNLQGPSLRAFDSETWNIADWVKQ